MNSNSRALWSCILGVVSLFCLFSLIAGIPAVLLGFFELSAIRNGKSPPQNRILAMIGIVFGILGSLVGIAFLIWVGSQAYLGLSEFFEGLMHSKWF